MWNFFRLPDSNFETTITAIAVIGMVSLNYEGAQPPAFKIVCPPISPPLRVDMPVYPT